MSNISSEFALKLQEMIFNHNIFYEYNVNNNTISIVYKNKYIIKDEKFDINNLVLTLDDENKKIIKDFYDLVLDECRNEQVTFKALDGNNLKVYLLEAFERHSDKDNIYGQVKRIKNLIINDERLKDLEKIDEGTGLMSKTSFRLYLEELINTKSFFVLALIELDYIKDIKELYGYIIENSVYEEISSSLKKLANEMGGNVGRFDGEIFSVALPLDHNPTQKELKELCLLIRKHTQIVKNTELVAQNLTVTIGICKYPFDGLTPNELIYSANRARFRGLAKGRACYVIYNPILHKSTNINDAISKYSPEGNSYVDLTSFIGDTLNSLLLNPTKEKALSKIAPLANALKVDRITIYKRDGLKLVCDYTWTDEINIHKPLIEVSKFSILHEQFVDGTLAVNDSVEYKRTHPVDNISIPDHVFAFTMLCIGPLKSADYVFSYEVFKRRRIWTSSQLLIMKIISKILIGYYLLGE